MIILLEGGSLGFFWLSSMPAMNVSEPEGNHLHVISARLFHCRVNQSKEVGEVNGEESTTQRKWRKRVGHSDGVEAPAREEKKKVDGREVLRTARLPKQKDDEVRRSAAASTLHKYTYYGTNVYILIYLLSTLPLST